jgi:hypothetical protein
MSTKRLRGVGGEVRYLNSEFINKKTGEAQYFRCYYDQDIVSQTFVQEVQLATNIYDDDCDTDDEQISQAAALIQRQLYEAIEGSSKE